MVFQCTLKNESLQLFFRLYIVCKFYIHQGTKLRKKSRKHSEQLFRGMILEKIPVTDWQVPEVWAVFKNFVRIPFNDCGILIQWGNHCHYSDSNDQLIYLPTLDFVRQFRVGQSFEQLHCKMVFSASSSRSQCEDGNLWSFKFPSVDEFFESVEQHNSFRAFFNCGLQPLEVRIYQGRV